MRTQAYPPEIEAQMRNFYRSLSENHRRRYAAVEAAKLGYGGMTYICSVLECDPGTVARGIEELKEPLPEKVQDIRKPGGGRKSAVDTLIGLDDAFLEVLRHHTAGSPVDETIKWTNLNRGEIAERLAEKGFPVSVTVVDQLLEKHHFRRRQAFKTEAGKKNIPNRDVQFKKLERLKEEYNSCGNPVMSMDVKKKN
jgi:hypothetical protein